MDQSSFFQSRNDFDIPTGGRAHPLEKRSGIACISQCAGRNHPYGVRARILDGAMKSSQYLHRGGDRLGRQKTVAEDRIPQAGDFAILMNLDEAMPGEARDL